MLLTNTMAKMPWFTELERVLYEQQNPCLYKRLWNLLILIVYLLSEYIHIILNKKIFTKYRVHVHPRAGEIHRYFGVFYRKRTKQPEMTVRVTS